MSSPNPLPRITGALMHRAQVLSIVATKNRPRPRGRRGVCSESRNGRDRSLSEGS